LRADYVTVVEDRPIMSAEYSLPVIFGQNWPTPQSHGLCATAEHFVYTTGCIVLFKMSASVACSSAKNTGCQLMILNVQENMHYVSLTKQRY